MISKLKNMINSQIFKNILLLTWFIPYRSGFVFKGDYWNWLIDLLKKVKAFHDA